MRGLFKLTLFIIYFLVIHGPNILISQDLPTFSLVDNLSVGLTPTAYEKFGVSVADFDRNGYPDLCCTRWQNTGFSRIYMNNGGLR